VRATSDLAPQRVGLLVAQPHRRQVVGGEQLASTSASTLSVLTLASAIARVLIGFETTTSATRGSISLAIACVLQVASIATSSVGARLSRNSLSASGVVAIWPAWRTRPPSEIATWANSRWTSSPMHLRMPSPFSSA